MLAILPSLLLLILLSRSISAIYALLISCLLSIAILMIQAIHLQHFVMPSLSTHWHMGHPLFLLISILISLGLISSILAMMIHHGVMTQLTQLMLRWARSEKRAGLLIILLGLIFHQGGTLSAMIVGFSTYELARSTQMTRAKLAFLVDTTASPVAILIPSSPWFHLMALMLVSTQISLFKEIDQAFDFLIDSIRFQFYAFFVLLMALLIALQYRIWGSDVLSQAVDLTTFTAETTEIEATEIETTDTETTEELARQVPFFVNILPLGLLILLILILKPLGLYALFIASLIAWLFAFVLSLKQSLSVQSILNMSRETASQFGQGGLILLLAMCQAYLSQKLGLTESISQWISADFPRWLYPSLCAIMAFAASFTTGTALGTLALLVGTCLQIAVQIDPNPIFLQVTFASLLGACVCGDHCSPISDTTITSSIFSKCPLSLHVRTQLPIALIAFIFSLLGSMLILVWI
jgi:Na+/H+ antiporter NhaC